MPTPPSPRTAGSGSHPSGQGRRQCAKVTRRPLPDPSAVELRSVPTTAPPYDDELLPPPASTPTSRPDPDHLLTTSQPIPAARHSPHGRHSPESRHTSDGQRSPTGQPAADRPAFATQFAKVLVESLAGTRPPRQLAAWTTERAKSRIQRIGPLLAAGHPPQLRRVVACRPAPDVIEMTVIIAVGPRTRALAIRLEHSPPPRTAPGQPPPPGRWICTDIEAA
jgi:uncharacterized protein DUF6459